MEKEHIQNLIQELVVKTGVKLNDISTTTDGPKNIWVAVEVNEPHFFISADGEGLHALSHIVHRIIEAQTFKNGKVDEPIKSGLGVIVDINGFQKKHIEGVRAVAHMMGERARYFKSSIEVDPMSAFERRIVHEFLSAATDLKTESIGMGRSRRVVIKYIGNL